MQNSQPTIWDLEPHTQAKHNILEYYLEGWFPILASRPRRLVYVDGFAGPGEYSRGEPGSPILALNVVLRHERRSWITRRGMELVFVFIEADEARFTNLERKLGEFHLPTNLNVLAFHGTFEEVLGSQLKSLEERDLALAPSFVFVDPFGPTGFPMALVERFAQYPMSEVLINFSYGPLNEWFLQDPSKHARLDDLFGGPRWRPALDKQPRQRELFLVSEYRAALQERGWRGLSFRMRNRHNQTQYYLLFGTRHYQGMLLMKSAMWQVAPDGVFQYSDFSDPNQLRLFTRTADGAYAQELAELLWSN